jgi:hypothetical protein
LGQTGNNNQGNTATNTAFISWSLLMGLLFISLAYS